MTVAATVLTNMIGTDDNGELLSTMWQISIRQIGQVNGL